MKLFRVFNLIGAILLSWMFMLVSTVTVRVVMHLGRTVIESLRTSNGKDSHPRCDRRVYNTLIEGDSMKVRCVRNRCLPTWEIDKGVCDVEMDDFRVSDLPLLHRCPDFNSPEDLFETTIWMFSQCSWDHEFVAYHTWSWNGTRNLNMADNETGACVKIYLGVGPSTRTVFKELFFNRWWKACCWFLNRGIVCQQEAIGGMEKLATYIGYYINLEASQILRVIDTYVPLTLWMLFFIWGFATLGRIVFERFGLMQMPIHLHYHGPRSHIGINRSPGLN